MLSMPRTPGAIDTILDTLYVNDLLGPLDAKVMRSAAIRRIKTTIERMEKGRRSEVEDEANYRLDRFEKFSHLSKDRRDEILRLARERQITIEEAYALTSES